MAGKKQTKKQLQKKGAVNQKCELRVQSLNPTSSPHRRVSILQLQTQRPAPVPVLVFFSLARFVVFSGLGPSVHIRTKEPYLHVVRVYMPT